MQENRSFASLLVDLSRVYVGSTTLGPSLIETFLIKILVWLQTNAKGETYAPFRLNIKDTNATWMGSLPHGWTDQVDARNGGAYDKWLDNKKSGHKEFEDMPLTMGYYTREDIPFYYALADAFTVCDQNFCSSLTGTTPNRLHLWAGKIREDSMAQARVRNEEADYEQEANWKTFPERLEENNISWKVYQNEISAGVGFESEEDAWLANFGDNPLEYFEQYQVRFLPAYINHLPAKIEWLGKKIEEAEAKTKEFPEGSYELKDLDAQIKAARKEIEFSQKYILKYTPENFAKLSQQEKNLHEKAFTTNAKDPDYHKLTTLKYKDGDTAREMKIPAGDLFYQLREDVKEGKLPTVSWIVAPENFSDHPSAPWYGAWYLSETMDILTKNPEVWKKTIFILCYDENDGYFDHFPPFVAPAPADPKSGIASGGIDTQAEYVSLEQDLKRESAAYARGSSIGLGYRVPLVIASPWSRGGAVCSQVFDHTSILQFLEKFLTHKTGKKIEETNISSWRRTVCGDLTSVFTPYNGEEITLPEFVAREEFVENIHKAQFKKTPSDYHALTKEEIEKANRYPSSSVLPRQGKGSRVSAGAAAYQLYAEMENSGRIKNSKSGLKRAISNLETMAAGSPFTRLLHREEVH